MKNIFFFILLKSHIMKTNRVTNYIILFFFLLSNLYSVAQLNIVSGIKGETYHQFANDIANNSTVKFNLYNSKGSSENIILLNSDSVNLAFLQYDVLYNHGIETEGFDEKIKVFLPLYNEEIQLITLETSTINSLKDLSGKKVGMSGENSGSNFTANFIKKSNNLEWQDFNIAYNNSVDALIKKEIDAFFYVGGVPSNFLVGLPDNISEKLKLVSLEDIENDDCYIETKIYAKTYLWQEKDVSTYSVKSLIAVNLQNVDANTENILDSLYNDLKSNIKGIRHNNFSHSKWESVDFTDMENVDWPVFKDEYTLPEEVGDILGWMAALLSFIQIYFIVNKLWKRKHEQLVAESISISAMFISLFINLFFGIQNLSSGGIPQLTGNILWIMASSISLIVGIGLFVNVNKGTSFFKLLMNALRVERNEAGDLAKRLFQPSSAEKIITILGRLAMIDNDLDDTEKKYIQEFANNWHIDINWEEIKKYEDKSSDKYNKLRDSVRDYIESSPPKEQASHLIDVISLLIKADGIVSDEEAIMESEICGILREYLGEACDVEIFQVAVVPQNDEQNSAVEARFSELKKVELAGGFAYLTESFYSEKYAEEICKQYRTFNIFSIVFNPRTVSDYDELLAR